MATLVDITNQLSTLNTTATELNTTATDTKTVTEKIHALLEANAVQSRAASRNAREAAREQGSSFGLIGGALAGVGAGAAGIGSGIGSILGGVGAMVGGAATGIGVGVGAAGLGIGALLAGGGYFLKALQDFDGKKVKENVLDLFAISEGFTAGMLGFFAESGTFAIAMTTIGVGLAVFGIGGGIAGLSDALTKYFGVGDWAKTVKNNVVTLMSIPDEAGGGILGLSLVSLVFTAAMVAIATGLAAFAVGGGIAGIGEAIARFGGGEDWATNTRNNVVTLLSIATLPALGDKVGDFIGSMTGIAVGLAIFAGGKGIAGVVEGIVDAVRYFSKEDFADRIKREVKTLLSIVQLEGIGVDTTNFVDTMSGISAGLVAFSFGKGVAGVTEGVVDAIQYFSGDENFAGTIKSQVETLLSIPALATPGDADNFALVMTKIGDGLRNFADAQLSAALDNLGTSILNFFTGAIGEESAFDQIRSIAGEATNLLKAADAIERVAAALNKFASITISDVDFNFKDLAIQLGQAIPFLEKLAIGGVVEGSGAWWKLQSDVEFPEGGLLNNPNLRLDEMSDAISKVNYILGKGETPSISTISRPSMPSIGAADIQPIPVIDRQIPGIIAAINASQLTNRGGGGGGARGPAGGPGIITYAPQPYDREDFRDRISGRG